jgi:hypothetical protein
VVEEAAGVIGSSALAAAAAATAAAAAALTHDQNQHTFEPTDDGEAAIDT